ncbi:MAG: Radical, partial [Polaromonas sp.]|nr:Radical [Polaromonas sp.]
LIFGLPGETLQSFADGFDRLHALAPHEIQFGILKRLRGTPITRHTLDFAMAYDPQTPYTILQTSTIDFTTMQRIQRFARYWEMMANSGRFALALGLLLGPGSAFGHFLEFSDWLWQTTGKTHEFAYEKLVDLLHAHLTTVRGLDEGAVLAALAADYAGSGARGRPACLAAVLAAGRAASAPGLLAAGGKLRAERQGRHVSQNLHREEIQKAAAAA